MLKKIILTISGIIFLFQTSIAEVIQVFEFTEEELKTLKVKKVKGKTTWSLGKNTNGNFIKAEAKGKASGLG